MNKIMPSTIYVVRVDNRVDDIYAFTAEREAERFLEAVRITGGDGSLVDVPLNLSPEHTDVLVAVELEDE